MKSIDGLAAVEKIEYGGWKNCYRVSNDSVEIIVTGDVGPRILRYGFIGRQNLFKEFQDQIGKTGESNFKAVAAIACGGLPKTSLRPGSPTMFLLKLASSRQVSPRSRRSSGCPAFGKRLK
ncbi:MAG: hypothetical protein ACREBW_06300 [Candidatus Micrarchaeaceae archaeon]